MLHGLSLKYSSTSLVSLLLYFYQPFLTHVTLPLSTSAAQEALLSFVRAITPTALRLAMTSEDISSDFFDLMRDVTRSLSVQSGDLVVATLPAVQGILVTHAHSRVPVVAALEFVREALRTGVK